VLFHLALALGFVPLLGVVLSAVGLAAARRDPAAARWRRPLLAVLLIDAVGWPALACVWLFGEPLIDPDASVLDPASLGWWEVWRPFVFRLAPLAGLIAVALCLRKESSRAALATRWVLLALLALTTVEAALVVVALPDLDPALMVLVLDTPPGLVLLVMALVALRWMRGRFGEGAEATERLSEGAGLGLGLLYFLGGFMRYAAVLEMVKILFPPERAVAAPAGDQPVTSALWVVLAMAPLSVVLAPLGEEVLFRGVLFTGLRSRIPLWRAYLLSALTFALIHDLAGINIVYFLWFGLVTAWARQRTGGLLVPIALHVGVNLSVLLRDLLLS